MNVGHVRRSALNGPNDWNTVKDMRMGRAHVTRSHPYHALSLFGLRETVFSTLATGEPPTCPHRREALRMPIMRTAFCRQIEHARTQADAPWEHTSSGHHHLTSQHHQMDAAEE
ncbi:hypothetical protein SprV_0301236200 [Sparganum proliferum]